LEDGRATEGIFIFSARLKLFRDYRLKGVITVWKEPTSSDWRFYYLETSGRLSQWQFWQGYLPILLIKLLLGLFIAAGLSPWVVFPVGVLTIYPTLALCIKRAHDIGLSGNYCWLFIVPLVNAFVFLTLAFSPGIVGDNRFGPDPKVSPHDLWKGEGLTH
jgi:uncharacterized membrane protein YhaH (DUF805 family)